MATLNKIITFFYTDKVEYQTLQPVAEEAQKRGYKVVFSEDIRAKAEIGFYCQHDCFPENSKFSVVLLHDMAQRHLSWPNIWRLEPWNKFDVAVLPGSDWANRWLRCSWYPPSRPRRGVYELGWPKADLIFRNKVVFEAEVEKLKSTLKLPFEKTVLYAPSWENDGKQDDFVKRLIKLPVNLLLKQAPCSNTYPQILENIRLMNELHQACAPNVRIIDPQISILYCLGLSDIIVSDESSVVVEALLLNVPSVAVLDWLIPDMSPSRPPEINLNFVKKTNKAELQTCVSEILADLGNKKRILSDECAKYFTCLGESSIKIIDLVDSVVERKSSGIMPLEATTISSVGDKYTVDANSCVWVPMHQKSFAYSDGDAEENYILKAMYSS